MRRRIHACLSLAALFGALSMGLPSQARAIAPDDRGPATVRGDMDWPHLIATIGVVALGCASLGGVALISRRQRGYLTRR